MVLKKPASQPQVPPSEASTGPATDAREAVVATQDVPEPTVEAGVSEAPETPSAPEPVPEPNVEQQLPQDTGEQVPLAEVPQKEDGASTNEPNAQNEPSDEDLASSSTAMQSAALQEPIISIHEHHERRWLKVLLVVVIIVVLILIMADVALDAGLIKTSLSIPHTHLFSGR